MLQPEMNISDPRIYRVPCANPFTLMELLFESLPYFTRRLYSSRTGYSFICTSLSDISEIRLNSHEIATVLLLALLLTLLRYTFQYYFKAYLPLMGIFPRYSHKLPETIWKFSYYGLAWLFSLYVVSRVEGVNVFSDPLSMWIGYESGNVPPMNPMVTVIYATQAAFYVHSIYATLFMDLWRKDSWLMFFHHFIALALLLLSYVDGFVLPGVLLVFLHDNSDAALECAKLGTYLKKRTDGTFYPAWRAFGNGSFVAFAVLWVIFRLYWYPCRLLYATLYGAVYLAPPDARFFPLLGSMLTLIFFMNIYWFSFIVKMVVRVATTGQEPEDNREWDTMAVSGLDKKGLDRLREEREREERRRAEQERKEK